MTRLVFLLTFGALAAACNVQNCYFPSPREIPEQRELVEALFDLATHNNNTITDMRLWAVPRMNPEKAVWPFLLQLAHSGNAFLDHLDPKRRFFTSDAAANDILNGLFGTDFGSFQVFDAFTVQVYLPYTAVQTIWEDRQNVQRGNRGTVDDYLQWCSSRDPVVQQLVQLPLAARIAPLAISQPNGAIQAYCNPSDVGCTTLFTSLNEKTITGATLNQVSIFPNIVLPCKDCKTPPQLVERAWCGNANVDTRIGECVQIKNLALKVGRNRIAIDFKGSGRERETLQLYLASLPSVVYVSTSPRNLPLLAAARNVQGGGQNNVCNMLSDHDLQGHGSTVGLVDMGIDMRSSFFTDPVYHTPCSIEGQSDLTTCNNMILQANTYKKASTIIVNGRSYNFQPKSRKVTSVVVDAGSDGTKGSDHGTAVAAAINGFSYNGRTFKTCSSSIQANIGVAPAAKISLYDVGAYDEANGWSISTPDEDYSRMFSVAQALGAHEFVVPFGSQSGGRYTPMADDIDRFMADNEDALVVVAAGNGGSVSSPAVSKNAIAIGASNQAFTGPADFTSVGPTRAGLVKPDILAPGANVELPQDDFDGPVSHCLVKEVSGTSISAGLIGGAATLVREYFENGYYPSGAQSDSDKTNVSAATIKAVLVNSARQQPAVITSSGKRCQTTDTSGHGAVRLERSLPFKDNHNFQMHMFEGIAYGAYCEHGGMCYGKAGGNLEVGANAGDNVLLEFSIKAENTDVPIVATLAWIDPPAVLGSRDKVVQDLTLEIEAPNGGVWKHQSVAECNGVEHAFAPVENTQSVSVTVPQKGSIYTVRVKKNFVFGSQRFSVVTTGGSVTKKDSNSLICCPKGSTATWAGCFDTEYAVLTVICVAIAVVAGAAVIASIIKAKKSKGAKNRRDNEEGAGQA